MKYHEVRQEAIPSLSFMKNTDYVLYVGPRLTWFQRRRLRTNKITSSLIYIPDIIKVLSKEVFEYNLPGVQWNDSLSVDHIYDKIRGELGRDGLSKNRLLIRFDGEELVVIDAGSGFSCSLSYLKEYVKEEKEKEEKEKEEQTDGIRFRVVEEDPAFNEQMIRTANQVRVLMKDLLLQGFPAELLRSWIDENIKLSRLRITKQFKIILVDYDREVDMAPLPLTVFLFFLRHPEGVRLPYLQDHVDELRQIYGRVSVNDDLQKMEASIAALVDPFNNSICEKCAAVKKAFMLVVEDSIARNYYITGAQGKKKGILLDRSLVEWECEL